MDKLFEKIIDIITENGLKRFFVLAVYMILFYHLSEVKDIDIFNNTLSVIDILGITVNLTINRLLLLSVFTIFFVSVIFYRDILINNKVTSIKLLKKIVKGEAKESFSIFLLDFVLTIFTISIFLKILHIAFLYRDDLISIILIAFFIIVCSLIISLLILFFLKRKEQKNKITFIFVVIIGLILFILTNCYYFNYVKEGKIKYFSTFHRIKW